MRTFKLFAIFMLYTGLCLPVQAAPKMVASLKNVAETYSVFFIDAKVLRKGITVPQAQATLTAQLAALTPPIKPCYTNADLNATNIRCGTGNTQMQLGSVELYSYNLETLLPGLPIVLDKGVHELMVANFVSPNIGIVGDTTGRIAHVHFTGRVAQFGLDVDPGINASAQSIQLVVNGQALPPQTLTPGVVQFVGVEDQQGFTDVTIISSSITRAFVADKFAFVPLAKF